MALHYVEAAPGVVALLTAAEVFAVRRLDGGAALPSIVDPVAHDGLDVTPVPLDGLDLARLPAGVTAAPAALPLGTPATAIRGLWRLCSSEVRPWWRPGLESWRSGARLVACEVLVVIAPGAEVPEAIRATAPAGEHRASLLPLASALDVARARSELAARDLAAPPPTGAVRVLYLDTRRSVAVCSAPSRVVGHVDPYDTPKGAA